MLKKTLRIDSLVIFIFMIMAGLALAGSREKNLVKIQDSDVAHSDIDLQMDGINLTLFNPLTLNIQLSTTSTTGFATNAIQPIFTLNDKEAAVSNIIITSNEISFTIQALEGKNELSISGVDGEGAYYNVKNTFYAGSKSLNINISSPTTTGTIHAYLRSDPEFKIEVPFSGSTLTLDNMPYLPLVVDVITDGNEFTFEIVEGASENAYITVPSNPTASLVVNNDFSTGTSGWTSNSSSSNVVNRIVNGTPIPGNMDLELLDNTGGGIEVRRTFLAGQADKFVKLRFNIQAFNDAEEVHAILRNITTGEITHKIYSGFSNREGPSAIYDVDHTISVKSENVNDVIDFQLETISGVSKSKLKKNTTNLIVIVNGFFFEPFDILSFYAHNLNGELINSKARKGYDVKLNTLSVGIVPFLSLPYKIPFNFMYRKTGSATINKVELIVDQRGSGISMTGSWIPTQGEAESVSEEYTRKNLPNNPNDPDSDIYNYYRETVRYAIEEISFNFLDVASFNSVMPLRLYLAIYLDNNEVHYAELGRPLIPLEYRGDLTDSRIKHMSADREGFMGGDSWGQTFVWDMLISIFDQSNNLGFKINDISRMQGGYFHPHKGHTNGLDVDYVVNQYFDLDDTEDPLNRWLLPQAVTNTMKVLGEAENSTGKKVIRYVDKIFISYNKEKEQRATTSAPWTSQATSGMTDVKREQRAGCSVDNRPTKNIIGHEDAHIGHGHIRFQMSPTPLLENQDFPVFRAYHKRDSANHRIFDFEVENEGSGGSEDITYIWDIREASNNAIVEVIDENTPEMSALTRGMLISTGPRLKSFRYQFHKNGTFKVNLVAIRKLPLSSEVKIERCLSQSFEVIVDGENIVNCSGEWQTYRGKDTINPLSGHKHIEGAIVSKDTIFEAGRFMVEDNTSVVCGESEIRDGYVDSSGCSEEDKYSCASIVLKGLVGVISSKIDATNGQVMIAGTDENFMDRAPIPPTNLSRGFGYDGILTLITDSEILPNGTQPMVIINSDIDGDGGVSRIKDQAVIQQANVWWANISNNAKVLGGTVYGLKNPSFPYNPQINVIGSSEIKGGVSSESRLDILDSLIDETGRAMGGGLISNSLIQGDFDTNSVDPAVFNSARIAKVENSSVLYGSTVAGKAHVLNGATVGAIGETMSTAPYIGENSLITDGAWVFGESSIRDQVSIKGSKVQVSAVIATENVIIDSTVGGTKSEMVLNQLQLQSNTKIYGTPYFNGGMAYDGYIGDDVVLTNVRVDFGKVIGEAEGVGSSVVGLGVVISEQAKFYSSGIADDAKMSGEAVLSNSSLENSANMSGEASVTNDSRLGGDAVLMGNAHVTNECYLWWGSWASGTFSGYTPPCHDDPPTKKTTVIKKRSIPQSKTIKLNCGSDSVSKTISSDTKRNVYQNFSRSCSEKRLKLEERTLKTSSGELKDRKYLEKVTRASVTKWKKSN